MHLAGADFPLKRANALSLDGWPPLFQAAEARADEVAPHLSAESAAELSLSRGALAAGPARRRDSRRPLQRQRVLSRREDYPGSIDFYFACNDALAYDLAICLSAWCFEPDNAFNVSKGRAMISGYERLRPLGEVEIGALPLLARGAALRFMLTRLVDWLDVPPGAKVAPKNPLEYRDKLRFHQRVKTAADYGLMR